MMSLTSASLAACSLFHEPGVTGTGSPESSLAATSEQVASKPIPRTWAGSTLESRRTSLHADEMQFQTVFVVARAQVERSAPTFASSLWGSRWREGVGNALCVELCSKMSLSRSSLHVVVL